MGFPNVETLLVAYLKEQLAVRVVTTIPANLEQILPVVRVAAAGGADDGLTDNPRVDVEVFAADRAAMWVLAEAARDTLHDLAGRAVNDKLVDTATTETRPFPLDYGNPAVHRAVATYRLALRRQ